MMRGRHLIAQTSALVAGKWVQDGLKFLLLLWLARTNQSGFGLFVFGFGVAKLIRSFHASGLDLFTIRELALDAEARGRILSQMIRLKVLVALLMLGGILSFGRLMDWNRTEVLVVLVISTGEILEGIANTFFSLYRYAGRQVQEAACSAKASLMGSLYGAAVLMGGGGVVAVSLFVVIAGGFKVLFAVAWGIHTRLMPKMSCWGAFLPTGKLSNLLIIAAVSLLGSFYNQVQILLMKHLRSLNDLALYGVALELAGGLSGLVSSLLVGGVLYPGLAREAAQGAGGLAAAMRAYFWRLAAFGLGTAFFFCTFGGDLLSLLYGPQYAGSLTALQVIALATVFSFVNNLFIHAFLAQHRERLLLLLHLAPTLVSLPLGFVLIPWLGAGGAALNLLACRVIMTILILIPAQRDFHILHRTQVGAFLGGGLILGGAYLGLLALDLPAPRLLATLALMGYAGWTWRWTQSPASCWDDGKDGGYEVS